jgi:pimeloyl-ACP methyl ester carboxylesterase
VTGAEQQTTARGVDRNRIVAGAGRVLGLLTTLPGRRDDAAAVVNGLFGDTLDDQGSSLATPMTIRSGETVLPLGRRALAAALPDAGPRICLLVHGLMSTESVWRFPNASSTTYGTLLAGDHGVTPLTLRYNSGRHISANGRELAQMLNRLVAAWPVRVREIDLIGHSMGGLVIRSACHYARALWPRGRYLPIGRPWTTRVRRVVLVGVPNTGAPLEVFVNLTSATLWSLQVPATRLLGLGLDHRSAGIKDLRFGAILDEDWQEQDPGARQRPHPHQVRSLPRAAYLVIGGSVTADPEHPLARLIGDTMVTSSSATGVLEDSSGNELFPGATVRLFPRMTHVALANRPEIYAAIDGWWPSTAQPPKRWRLRPGD